ncbi:MAG: hypothetical protein E7049_01190 [Lentisphaerae bacterium]|nr:hypothetical protein [Lentisphaerota bacterium]
MKISLLRIAVCAVVGTVVIGALLACCFLRSRTTGVDTSTVRKEIRFYRSGTEWFADVPQHTKAAGQEGVQIAWLCNVMHTVFGGEHPTDIYIHSITAKRP